MPFDKKIEPFDDGVEITVPGHRLVVPELSLKQREQLEERILKLPPDSGATDKDRVNISYEVVTAALRRHYPDATEDEVRELFTARKLAVAIRAAVAFRGEDGRPLVLNGVQESPSESTGSKSTDASSPIPTSPEQKSTTA